MSEDPIIDQTDLPLSTWLRIAGPVTGAVRYLWLKALRPLMLVAVWALFLFYVYWDFFMALSSSTSDMRFLVLCGVGIFTLLAAMLLTARLVRNREDNENEESDTAARAQPVQVQEMAEAAKVPVRQLSLWQRARSVVALHDDDGHFRAAVLKPLGEPVRRTPRPRR
ncbi:hypothetical protein [Bordetella genomosp. 13]|uniref:hypothetical protein n=1 Tax=Bordetella genomosp. 13 TaxID=463040 RepID=UPI00119FE848|nr:hypothetical protein [Bordetella genomosp. 13]